MLVLTITLTHTQTISPKLELNTNYKIKLYGKAFRLHYTEGKKKTTSMKYKSLKNNKYGT